MANICEKLIGSCIAQDCDNPMFPGVDGQGLIANFSDIVTVTYDQTNPSIINGITMKTDTCFYTIQQLGNQPFSGSQTEMTEGTYGNKFNNTVNFAVLDNGPQVTNDIEATYSVYGIKKGLRAASITRELYGDNESAWVCSMTEENAPQSGLFFYVTDSATTETAINALKCTC